MHSIDGVVHACITLLRLNGYQMPCSSSNNHSGASSAASSAATQQRIAGSGDAGGGSSDRVAVVAHSYGTFVACRLLQLYGPALHSLALLDPVCCGMFMPHVSSSAATLRRGMPAACCSLCLDHRCCLQCLGGQQCHNALLVGA